MLAGRDLAELVSREDGDSASAEGDESLVGELAENLGGGLSRGGGERCQSSISAFSAASCPAASALGVVNSSVACAEAGDGGLKTTTAIPSTSADSRRLVTCRCDRRDAMKLSRWQIDLRVDVVGERQRSGVRHDEKTGAPKSSWPVGTFLAGSQRAHVARDLTRDDSRCEVYERQRIRADKPCRKASAVV